MARKSKLLAFLSANPATCSTLFLHSGAGIVWHVLVAILAVVFGFSTAIAAKSEEVAGEPWQAVATVGMIGDLVQAVAGDRARVESLIAAGGDPHVHKPTRGDMLRLQQADWIFFLGLNLEGAMAHVLHRLAKEPQRKILAVGEALREQEKYAVTAGEEGAFDPHLWMDVQGWKAAAALIAKTLAEWEPEHAADYHHRGELLAAQLEALDRYAREVLATIPENQRILITAHDAFGYFGRAYGLEVRGVQGLSTESEAGLRDLEALVDFIVAHRVPAVFVESSLPERSVLALLEGARARGHPVALGGELFSDSMGAAGTYEGTYVGMMDHNITTITRALGGTVPEGGFRKWLQHQKP